MYNILDNKGTPKPRVDNNSSEYHIQKLVDKISEYMATSTNKLQFNYDEFTNVYGNRIVFFKDATVSAGASETFFELNNSQRHIIKGLRMFSDKTASVTIYNGAVPVFHEAFIYNLDLTPFFKGQEFPANTLLRIVITNNDSIDDAEISVNMTYCDIDDQFLNKYKVVL